MEARLRHGGCGSPRQEGQQEAGQGEGREPVGLGEGTPSEFLAFEFELSDPLGPIEEDADRLRNVVAEFRLFVGMDLLYRDRDFPIVELVLALAEWCDHVETSGRPFSFDSRFSAFPSLFRIFRGVQGWHLASIQGDLPSPSVFSLQQILTEVRRFMAEVETAVFDAFGFSTLALRR